MEGDRLLISFVIHLRGDLPTLLLHKPEMQSVIFVQLHRTGVLQRAFHPANRLEPQSVFIFIVHSDKCQACTKMMKRQMHGMSVLDFFGHGFQRVGIEHRVAIGKTVQHHRFQLHANLSNRPRPVFQIVGRELRVLRVPGPGHLIQLLHSGIDPRSVFQRQYRVFGHLLFRLGFGGQGV